MDVKPFYRQLVEGGKLSVCGEKTAAPCSWDDDNMPHFQPGFMVRVSGDVRLLTREEVTEKAAANPQFNVAIYDINKYPETRVLVLHSAWGELYDYDFNMVHRDHKILRERFAWGGATFEAPGFPSPMRASSAVPAPMPAPTRPSWPARPTPSSANAATSAATATMSALPALSSARAFRKIRRQPWEENQKRAEKLQPPFRAHTRLERPRRPEHPPHGDIVSLMSRTLGAANRYLVELMAREGLAGIVPSHGDILMQLFAHDAMSMAALAEAIGKDPSTVTALVRKLANAGYVEKAPNPRDRRMCEVRLTDAGRALEPDQWVVRGPIRRLSQR